MADNVRLGTAQGTGALIASDQNGTAEHYQWIKLVYGGDNEFSKVDGTDGLPVQVITALPAGTAEIGKIAAGTAQIGVVVLGAGSTQVGKLAAGTAQVGVVIIGAGTAAIGKLAAGTAAIGKLAAGTAAIGKLAAGTAEIGKVAAGTANVGNVGVYARSTGGAKKWHSTDLDESGELVTGSPNTVYGMYFWNLGTAPLFLELHDATAVTGTTTNPTVLMIPANGDSDGAGFVVPLPAQGIAFTAGLVPKVVTALGGTAGPGATIAGGFISYQD